MPCVCYYCKHYELYTIKITKNSIIHNSNYFFNRVNPKQYYSQTLENFTKYFIYNNYTTYYCSSCLATDNTLIHKSNSKYVCNNCKSDNVYYVNIIGSRITIKSVNTSKNIINKDFHKSGFINHIKWLNEVYYCNNCNIITSLIDWDANYEDKYKEAPWINEKEYYKYIYDISPPDLITEDTDNNSDSFE